MFKPVSTTLWTTLLVGATSSFAQSIQPGLWEINHKIGGNPQMDQAMAQMQKQLTAMPPAQRKQMEAMLGQQGVSMPSPAADGGMAMKVCITPEMAARQDMPSQTEGECTTTITSRSTSTMNMKFVCKNPPSSGEGTYTFNGDKAYSVKMVIHTTNKDMPASMTMDGQGKWLSADCGAVKPIK